MCRITPSESQTHVLYIRALWLCAFKIRVMCFKFHHHSPKDEFRIFNAIDVAAVGRRRWNARLFMCTKFQGQSLPIDTAIKVNFRWEIINLALEVWVSREGRALRLRALVRQGKILSRRRRRGRRRQQFETRRGRSSSNLGLLLLINKLLHDAWMEFVVEEVTWWYSSSLVQITKTSSSWAGSTCEATKIKRRTKQLTFGDCKKDTRKLWGVWTRSCVFANKKECLEKAKQFSCALRWSQLRILP